MPPATAVTGWVPRPAYHLDDLLTDAAQAQRLLGQVGRDFQ